MGMALRPGQVPVLHLSLARLRRCRDMATVDCKRLAAATIPGYVVRDGGRGVSGNSRYQKGTNMSGSKWFRVTIIDHDYQFTKYSVATDANSVNQAIAMGAARIAVKRTQEDKYWGATLLDPEVMVEKIDLDSYWAERDEVKIHDW